MTEIVNQYDVYLNTIGRRIKTIRSRLRGQEIRNEDFVDFVLIEDQLNDFLSALTPTNAILRRLLLGKHIALYADDEDLVEDLLLNNEQSIEACQADLKTIVNIREAYSTIMSNNLNRIIRILTVATVLLEASTLIGTFYGMNVELPFANKHYTFAALVLFTVAINTSLLLFLRKKRLL
jgi:magnesium transporter